MEEHVKYTFGISLSVLNNLGRHLYRSFVTVLGEAISNSWDADAKEVDIIVDKRGDRFFIKDDGNGMDSKDFQDKFLRIGYSKRAGGSQTSPSGRPYIGRKGIGKLALLSCSDRVSIISKRDGGEYIGGTIDNKSLDNAITQDIEPDKYPLENFNLEKFEKLTEGHRKGTIICFEGMTEGTKRSLPYLRKTVALYFRFSLYDENFIIKLNGMPINFEDISELSENTEYLWKLNDLDDPYFMVLYDKIRRPAKTINLNSRIKGFVASVSRPSNLKIFGTGNDNQGERVGIDLFVNGRLRERNIISHIPTSRLVENYLYGQIHFNILDDPGTDRFTSSREGVVADDPKFRDLLEEFNSKVLSLILEDWDKWRLDDKEEGDIENQRISKKERNSRGLYNAVIKDFISTGPIDKSEKTQTPEPLIDKWVNDLSTDAAYNFESYAECFISENLIRKQVEHDKLPLTIEAMEEITNFKEKEEKNKQKANISIEIRRNQGDLGYLSMDGLANLVDKVKDKNNNAGLSRDALEYKPVRDALMHTSLLTEEAKKRVAATRNNIKARVKTLVERSKGAGN
jgi:hypothetical protein